MKSGDRFIVTKSEKRRIVLRPASASPKPGSSRKSYLTPRALSRTTLLRVYSSPNSNWDKIESEAASRSRKALKGKRLEDL